MPSPVNGLDAPAKTALVKVGAATYELQWGPLAEYILSSRALTVFSMLPELNAGGPRATAYRIEMLAAFTAHQFRADAAPNPRDGAARLLPGQLDEAFLAMRGLLIDAGQWRPLAQPKNVHAPTTEPSTDQAPKA